MKNGVSYVRGTGVLDAFGQTFPVRNKVRNFQAGSRNLFLASDVILTEPPDGSKGVPYMPGIFPVGEWNILDIITHSTYDQNGYLYPYFISTDVKVQVAEWLLDDKGNLWKPSGRLVWDSAYGLHCSNSETSAGCINVGPVRQSENDTTFIRSLVTLLRPYLAKGKVPLLVTDRV